MRSGPTRSRATSARSSTPTRTTSAPDGVWTMIEMGHLMAMGPAVVLPALEYLFHRVEQQVRRAADAAHPGRGVALSQPRGLRDAPSGVAQDAAQEERLRRLRDAGGGRRDEQAGAALDHPLGLPHEDLPARRRGADAGDDAGLPGRGPDDRRDRRSSPRRRRSATTTTARSKAGASSSSGSGPRRSRFVGASSEHDQRFLDELVATRAACATTRAAMLERRGVALGRVRARRLRPPTRAGTPRDDAQTVPMTAGALAELLSVGRRSTATP